MSSPLPLFLPASVSLPAVSFLKIRRYAVSDALNTVPELTIEVFSEDASLDMAELLGQEATAQLDEPAVARFDGIVRRVEQRALNIAAVSVYALTIVPRLWLTTERSGHRIFQNRTALGIVADVLAPYGPRLERPDEVLFQRVPPTYEYRVQCGETDHDFLFRILSEQGLVSCFFLDPHGRRRWTVLDDTTAGGVDMEVPYRPASGALAETAPHVSVATLEARLCPAEVRLRDYDHHKPAFLLEQRCIEASGVQAEEPLARYSFAVGRFEDEAGGDRLCSMRLEEARSKSRTYRWEASFAMRPGMKIRLCDHPREDANGDFLVVSAWSEVDMDARKHVAEVVPASSPWRPAVRPKPRIQGTQTAFVAGTPGKEIDVDKEGRIAVRFHWDTRKEGASRRVRVAMPWMGADRGFWTLPRVGDEVVIGYLDGDPDQPIVVGSVNNAVAPPLSSLPESQTQSWWCSKSTPGGNGYNAVVMEDLAGSELLGVYAQRDFFSRTGRRSETFVGENQILHVKGSQSAAVSGGHSAQVGGDSKTAVKGQYELTASNIQLTSTGDVNLAADGTRYDGSRCHMIISKSVQVSGDEVVNVSSNTVLKLEVGASSITLEPGKITIVSPMVEINP